MKSFDNRWDSPWGLEKDSEPHPREELFPPADSKGPGTWYLEDFLQHNGVFYNGLRGEDHPCHSDSYMTCVSFDRLTKCIDLLQETYGPTTEEWKLQTDRWLGSPNMQPPLRIVANTICGRFGIERIEPDMKKWH